jgi:hypothetical protein
MRYAPNHERHGEIGMGNKAVVVAGWLIGLAATGQLAAQTAADSVKNSDAQHASSSIHQPLNLQMTPMANASYAVRTDQSEVAAPANRFDRVFKDQAHNGDPRRVPMYLLVPFAKVTPAASSLTFGAHPTDPADQPNVVNDVGALVRTIKAGG